VLPPPGPTAPAGGPPPTAPNHPGLAPPPPVISKSDVSSRVTEGAVEGGGDTLGLFHEGITFRTRGYQEKLAKKKLGEIQVLQELQHFRSTRTELPGAVGSNSLPPGGGGLESPTPTTKSPS